jgi:hypothetical protein
MKGKVFSALLCRASPGAGSRLLPPGGRAIGPRRRRGGDSAPARGGGRAGGRSEPCPQAARGAGGASPRRPSEGCTCPDSSPPAPARRVGTARMIAAAAP